VKSKRKVDNTIVDFAKLFFAICIVLIHTELSIRIPHGMIIREIIFRVGVPYFFICSGYFFAKAKNKKDFNFKETLKHYIYPYFFWGLIYLILYAFFVSGDATLFIKRNFIKYLIFMPTSNIMWYSGSLIVSIFILNKIKDKKVLVLSIVIAFILYLIGLGFTSYDFVLDKINSNLLQKLINVFHNNRNVIFVGYLYIAIGYLIYNINHKVNTKKMAIVTAISFVLMCLEAYYVVNHVLKYDLDFLILHIPFTALLFVLTINIPCNKNTKKIRGLSTNMYYTQFLFIYPINYYLFKSPKGMDFYVTIYYDLFILSCVLVFCFMIQYIPNSKVKKCIFS
jgi:fucose 4-O-acetylase-like acetyltransferase